MTELLHSSDKPKNFMEQAADDEARAEQQRERDRKIDLLITPKNHQRLRAFGYEVIQVADSLPASTSDRRSL